MAAAGDVPKKFDVVINGQGYILDKSFDDSPYRRPPALYGFTPTFLERTNISDKWGDDTQAFFLTASQNDFALGAMRRYHRTSDADSPRRYWLDKNIDPVSVPGQVTLTRTTPSLTFAAAVRACCSDQRGVFTVSSTKLYLVDLTGTITDEGAHGLGANPSQWGVASDTVNIYVSTTTAGTVGVRKWNGAAWSTWSATPADSLAFLNNVVYGYREDTGELIEYSTTGVASTIFQWKDGSGTALTGATYATRLKPYGGNLLILRKRGVTSGELWQFNGSDTSELGAFPANFVAQDIEVVSGIVFITGYMTRNTEIVPAIFYYISGQVDQLWASNVTGYTDSTWPAIAAYGDGVVFTDDTRGNLMQYNISVGGVHTIGTYTVTNATPMMAANQSILVHTRNGTAGYYYPSTTVNTTGFIITSLFDFDNSLTKLPRGIKVDWEAATDGDGGSVDIAYQFDSVDGSFTNLQTAAVSGTEYGLPSTQKHSISVKVTINKGTSTNGPKLKRVYVRGVPVLQAYRHNQYMLDLVGNKSADPQMYLTLVDGSTHTKDGDEMAADLVTAINAGPITITDRFGTFTGIIEPGESDIRQTRTDYGRGEYRAELTVREI